MIGNWKYFEACNDVDSLRREYRKQAFVVHPDRGGSTQAMQELNAEYERALKYMAEHATGQTSNGYKFEADQERSAIDKLSEFLASRAQGIDVELVGTWIWADTTRENFAAHNLLKGLSFEWSPKRKRWYYATNKMSKVSKKHWHSKLSMDEIRSKYGSQRATRASYSALDD